MIKWLTFFLLVSVLLTSWINFIPFKLPELINGGGKKFEQIMDALSLSYIASYLFYLINIYFPEKREKKHILPWIARKIQSILTNNKSIREYLIHSTIQGKELITEKDYRDILILINPKEKPKSKDVQLIVAGKSVKGKSIFRDNWQQYLSKKRETTISQIETVIVSSKYVDERTKVILYKMRDSLFLREDYAFNTADFQKESLVDSYKVFHDYFKLIDELQEHYKQQLKKYYQLEF